MLYGVESKLSENIWVSRIKTTFRNEGKEKQYIIGTINERNGEILHAASLVRSALVFCKKSLSRQFYCNFQFFSFYDVHSSHNSNFYDYFHTLYSFTQFILPNHHCHFCPLHVRYNWIAKRSSSSSSPFSLDFYIIFFLPNNFLRCYIVQTPKKPGTKPTNKERQSLCSFI